jgi:signal recognition particle subunit SEC65
MYDDSYLRSKIKSLEKVVEDLSIKCKIKDKDIDIYNMILDLKDKNDKLEKIIKNLCQSINEIEAK